MLNKLTVLCFSPTGGTAKAAGFTASALAESVETVDLLRPVTPRTFTAEDTVLIAMPVFGGRIPAYALEQLRAFQGGNARAVTLAVFGNRDFDDALLELNDAAAAAADGTAFVFMGHGTSHTAKVSYSQMQTAMQTLGYDNVFIGTVEGEPEDTACDAVIEKVKEAGYTKVILRPLMVVAGDHANNDMAGAEDDSWLSQFNAADCFESVDTQIAGLGEIGDIQQLYVEHAGAAIDSLNG